MSARTRPSSPRPRAPCRVGPRPAPLARRAANRGTHVDAAIQPFLQDHLSVRGVLLRDIHLGQERRICLRLFRAQGRAPLKAAARLVKLSRARIGLPRGHQKLRTTTGILLEGHTALVDLRVSRVRPVSARSCQRCFARARPELPSQSSALPDRGALRFARKLMLLCFCSLPFPSSLRIRAAL
jgi:hypothetical protein